MSQEEQMCSKKNTVFKVGSILHLKEQNYCKSHIKKRNMIYISSKKNQAFKSCLYLEIIFADDNLESIFDFLNFVGCLARC